MDAGQAITEAMMEQRWRDAWRAALDGIRWRRPIRTADPPPAPYRFREWKP